MGIPRWLRLSGSWRRSIEAGGPAVVPSHEISAIPMPVPPVRSRCAIAFPIARSTARKAHQTGAPTSLHGGARIAIVTIGAGLNPCAPDAQGTAPASGPPRAHT